jgi:hypothetical protein
LLKNLGCEKEKDEKRKGKFWNGIDIRGSIRNAGIRKHWMRFRSNDLRARQLYNDSTSSE